MKQSVVDALLQRALLSIQLCEKNAILLVSLVREAPGHYKVLELSSRRLEETALCCEANNLKRALRLFRERCEMAWTSPADMKLALSFAIYAQLSRKLPEELLQDSVAIQNLLNAWRLETE